jgi:uncharacterized protein YciI
MEPSKTIGQQFEAARQLEKDSRLSDAAAIYQKLVDRDPVAQNVIERLLIIYRKLKDYHKELSVLNDAIAAFQRRGKDAREKWIQTHPNAARVGKSMLRQLEKADSGLSGLGVDPLVDRLLKRRDLLARKISGKKGAKTDKKQRQPKEAAATKKSAAEERQEASAARKKAVEERKADLAQQKKEEREQKAAEAETQLHPSLFVIVLRYLVSLDKIDAIIKQHMSYLDKHYKNREFLVSGRQVPRTGGIILARAKNRAAMEKTIKQDPFVKRKLASADIIEFNASQIGKGLEGWLK